MEYLKCCSWEQRMAVDPINRLKKCLCRLITLFGLVLFVSVIAIFVDQKGFLDHRVLLIVIGGSTILLIISTIVWIVFYIRDAKADSDAEKPEKNQRLQIRKRYVNGPDSNLNNCLQSDNNEEILSTESILRPKHDPASQLLAETGLRTEYSFAPQQFFTEAAPQPSAPQQLCLETIPNPMHNLISTQPSTTTTLTGQDSIPRFCSPTEKYEITKVFYFDEDLEKWKCKDSSSLDSGSSIPNRSREAEPDTEIKQHSSGINTMNKNQSDWNYQGNQKLSSKTKNFDFGEETNTSLRIRGRDNIASNPNPAQIYSRKRSHTLPSLSKMDKDGYILLPETKYSSTIPVRRLSSNRDFSTTRDVRVQNRRSLTNRNARVQNRRSSINRNARVQNRRSSTNRNARFQNRRSSTSKKTAPNHCSNQKHHSTRQNVNGNHTRKENISNRNPNKEKSKSPIDSSNVFHLSLNSESFSSSNLQLPKNIHYVTPEDSISNIVRSKNHGEERHLESTEDEFSSYLQPRMSSSIDLPAHKRIRLAPIGDSSPSNIIPSPQSIDSIDSTAQKMYFIPPDESFASYSDQPENHPSKVQVQLELSEDGFPLKPQSHMSPSHLSKVTHLIAISETSPLSTTVQSPQSIDLSSAARYFVSSDESFSPNSSELENRESKGTPIDEERRMESNVDNSVKLQPHRPPSLDLSGIDVIFCIPNKKSRIPSPPNLNLIDTEDEYLTPNEKSLTHFPPQNISSKDISVDEELHSEPSDENLTFNRQGYQRSTPIKDHSVAERKNLTSNKEKFSFDRHCSQNNPTEKEEPFATNEERFSSKGHGSTKYPPKKNHPSEENHLTSNEGRFSITRPGFQSSPPNKHYPSAEGRNSISNEEILSINHPGSLNSSPNKYHLFAKGKNLISIEKRLSLSCDKGKHFESNEGNILSNFQYSKSQDLPSSGKKYQVPSEETTLSSRDIGSESLPRVIKTAEVAESRAVMLDGEISAFETDNIQSISTCHINMGTFPPSPGDKRSLILQDLWSSVIKNDESILPGTDPCNPDEPSSPIQAAATEPPIVSYKQLAPDKFLVGVNMNLTASELYDFMIKRGNFDPCTSDV